MGDQPSNDVLATKIDSLREIVNERFDVNEAAHQRLTALIQDEAKANAKNTAFREKGSVYLVLAAAVITTILSTLANDVLTRVLK